MTGGGGGVRKFKDIIFGRLYCMALGYNFSACVFFLGYEFDVMAVSGAVCAFY